MSTTTPAAPPVVKPPAPKTSFASRFGWPLGFLILAIVVFSFNQWILPDANGEFRTGYNNWLPMTAVNEAVIWAIFALGLNIVVGYSGLLDLGYVAFWGIGGYVAGWLMAPFANQVTPAWADLSINIFGHPLPGQDRGIHINFWLVLIIAALVCALAGVIIGAPTLRLKSDYLALVTLGFGEILPEVFRNGERVGPDGKWNITNGTKGITGIDQIPTGPFQLIPGVPATIGTFDLTFKFIVFALLLALAMFVSLRIREGRLGRAWLAIREDELAASMMGVPLMRIKLSAYAVGAAFGGIGGVCYATHVGGVLADRFNFSVSITLLAMVVLGGMGNVWGVTVGALVLAWINSTGLAQLGNVWNDATGSNVNFASHNFLIFGAVLVLFMLFRREGLIPETRTKQVLQEPERGEIESLGAEMEGTAEDTAAEGTKK
ncbi:branched-chain amino acid ABC transporter permease [Kineosporia sp. NBRC 101731]|uniref:branched-chain amino acid ABC transporter permease n=1 Tax=Kineosporia sp. NBRC 101731 TaxID=3032199 RepID=UPI0024A31159|nr:branched-chain amino acid ABC transporter permease [Kineosporia sp. NBRC 101731]GLY30658.1 branched-chain amino acid ABC transporter permease [Kineosporia sp. NBRC 101731]